MLQISRLFNRRRVRENLVNERSVLAPDISIFGVIRTARLGVNGTILFKTRGSLVASMATG